jgi:hypothetical protein
MFQNNANTRLNEQQLDMLQLFKNPMSQDDYDQIKRLAVKILAKNIDEEMNNLEKKNEWNTDTYEQWGKEHLRTPYKK